LQFKTSITIITDHLLQKLVNTKQTIKKQRKKQATNYIKCTLTTTYKTKKPKKQKHKKKNKYMI